MYDVRFRGNIRKEMLPNKCDNSVTSVYIFRFSLILAPFQDDTYREGVGICYYLKIKMSHDWIDEQIISLVELITDFPIIWNSSRAHYASKASCSSLISALTERTKCPNGLSISGTCKFVNGWTVASLLPLSLFPPLIIVLDFLFTPLRN